MYKKLISGVYTIAEMSANHSGSLENALNIVRAAKASGADCVKIQTYTADTMTIDIKNKYFKIDGGLWDGRYLYDLYKEASTPWEWHQQIYDECKKIDIDFLSTPFDKSAVDFLESLDIKFYKVASFELTDLNLIRYIASKKKPIIISTGMGSIEEIQDAVNVCREEENNEIVLLKCKSEYPADYSNMNLATIEDMRSRFNCPIGLSDHSMGYEASFVAASMGAVVIEKHFCLSRFIKNADSEFSMEPHEFKEMVGKINLAAKIRGEICYDLSAAEKKSTVFRRSLFATKDIEEDELFSEDNIKSIRPSYGDLPKNIGLYLNHKSSKKIKKGTPLSKDYIK